ncbi:MAG TPA: TolC family protein [Bryobacteraceae bacterium]|nr:TolC family protein [Bryobacteraceae bacterium]
MPRCTRSASAVRSIAHVLAVWLMLETISLAAFAQSFAVTPNLPTQKPAPHNQTVPERGSSSLEALINEAGKNNPQILAAKDAWRAATQVPSQVSTLPDPQFTVQQFAVGSPRPFAGFTNSNFAYIGFGVSQDLPYPGKLRLRGEAAKLEADTEANRVESVRRTVIEQLKAAYFQLAYELEELSLLDRDGKLLDQVAQIAEADYRVGKGNEQDVLKAQLEKTKLLATIEMHHQEHFRLEAKLKQLLNRPLSAADIIPDHLTETAIHASVDDLLAKIRAQNPDIRGRQQMIQNKSVQVEIAHKNIYPDFNVQYMWQHTAAQYRDYYMLTVGARIPIHQSRKQWPEVEQAVQELHQSQRDYEAQVQQAYFDLRDQYLKAETAERVLNIYQQGLVPQAANTFKAGLAAYQSNREDFETLLNSFLDVLRLGEEYWRNLLDHELAVAQIEQITGIHLNKAEE